uniref:Uncharacterized protein n=1 Tax=viral metagenome TaxID=1070528 RepID=A0A6M3K7I0_9ZZZZ
MPTDTLGFVEEKPNTAENSLGFVEINPIVPELRNAPPATFIEKLKSFFGEKPEMEIAKAQNIYALSKVTGLGLKDVSNNYDLLRRSSKVTGITPDLETQEYFAIATMPFIAAGAVTNPIGTAAGLLAFAALDKAIPIDEMVTGYEKQTGMTLSSDVKSVINLIDFVGKGLIVGGVFKKAPKLAEGFLRNKLVEYNMAKDIKLSAEQVRDIYQTGKLTTADEATLFGSLGLKGTELKTALEQGVKITIPAEKLTTLVDKPIWAKIKSIVGVESKPKVTSELAGKPEKTVAGLIEGATTPEKPILPTPQPQGGTITPELEPLAIEARKYKSAEEFLNGIINKKGDLLTELDLVQKNDFNNLRDFYNQSTQPTGEGKRLNLWREKLAQDRRLIINKKDGWIRITKPLGDQWRLETSDGLDLLFNSSEDALGYISTLSTPTGEGKVIDNLNPTGSIFADYTPEKRATMPLGENITTLDKTLGKSPDEIITIYRGTGKGNEIIAGDFITTNKQLAKDYAGTGNIIEKKVKLSDILDDKTEPLGEEYIYRPKLTTPTGQKPPIEPPKTIEPPLPPTPPPVEQIQPEPPSDPVQKIINALKGAKDIRGQQETLYHKARQEKLAKMMAVGERVKGEKGFFKEKGALKGELPKVAFESIRKELKQEDIDTLFDMVKATLHLNPWDKLTAREGLANLLGETGGKVPTESEIAKLHKVFGKEFTDTLLEKRPLIEKMKEAGLQIANFPRSIMASFDLSFGLRQGSFAAPRFRKAFFDSFKKQFSWFGSEKAFQENQKVIASNPNYSLAVESGVQFTEMDSLMGEREERFASQWAEIVPGVRQSARAYTGFANKYRMDIFDTLVQDAQKLGLNPQKDRDLSMKIAKFVNSATGRGSLGDFERSAVLLNAFFFSPRLMASRIGILTKLLDPRFYYKESPFIRKEFLKTALSWLGTGLTIMGIAKLMGAEVGDDPISSDFGKEKIGITRIDHWGGFQPYIRMLAQVISGKYKSSTTGKIMTLGEGYRPLTRLEILQRQVESKEAPVFSFITELLKGQTFEGKKINIPKAVGLRFVPMVVQDLYDIIKDNPEATAVMLLAPFGVGVQTYKRKPGKKF